MKHGRILAEKEGQALSTLKEDALYVVKAAVAQTHPRQTMRIALDDLRLYGGRLRVIAIGSAAWDMAEAAEGILGNRIECGLVITPYGGSRGALTRLNVMEAGYPVPDANSVRATDAAIALVQGLDVEDTVLMLISGGGSSLLEKPLIPLPLYATTMSALVHCGADVRQANLIRKRLSAVKGGRFAKLCAPAGVLGLLLSDVMGDAPEVIASGPISPDPTTVQEAEGTLLRLLPDAPEVIRALMRRETPKALTNAETRVIGNVNLLVRSAAHALRRLGYETVVLSDRLSCDAAEAGRFLAAIALSHQQENRSVAFLVGGQTAFCTADPASGGRNMELALAAVPLLDGLRDTALFAAASDGLDGATDAAGGYVDHRTAGRLRAAGIDMAEALANHETARALRATDGLLYTGPTGTRVNDIAAVLIRR